MEVPRIVLSTGADNNDHTKFYPAHLSLVIKLIKCIQLPSLIIFTKISFHIYI